MKKGNFGIQDYTNHDDENKKKKDEETKAIEITKVNNLEDNKVLNEHKAIHKNTLFWTIVSAAFIILTFVVTVATLHLTHLIYKENHSNQSAGHSNNSPGVIMLPKNNNDTNNIDSKKGVNSLPKKR